RSPKTEAPPLLKTRPVVARPSPATNCVRVGARVSFSTVVQAILIPSVADLNIAARHRIWWQEEDYRVFRANFVDYIRSSPNPAEEEPEEEPEEEMDE
ncbi:unnamed protein product, partial [Discosporangium mesarthrocarpum]